VSGSETLPGTRGKPPKERQTETERKGSDMKRNDSGSKRKMSK
jgi:hypothetical protein